MNFSALCRERLWLDHSFDHLRIRTTWKQCLQEHSKALFSDTKAPKSLVNQGKNRCRFVWDVDAAGSNPVTPTKICALCTKKSVLFARLGLIFCLLSPTCSCAKRPQFLAKRFLLAQDTGFACFFKSLGNVFLKIPFLCFLRRKF